MRLIVFFSFLLLLGCSAKNFDKNEVLINEDFDGQDSVKFEGVQKNLVLKKDGFDGGYIKLLPKKGISIKYKVDEDCVYKFSAWRKNGKASLKLFFDDEIKTRLLEDLAYVDHNGWQKVELIANTFFLEGQTNVKIEVFNSSKDTVSIDKVLFEKLNRPNNDFKLKVNRDDIGKIVKYRKVALKNHFISDKEKKEINAELNKKPVNIKLKGDWTDHIRSGVWSFKVTGKKEILDGAKQVTFQSIKARNMLKEWCFLRLCSDADIVTPFYDLKQVSINKGSSYLCVAEESFNKSFIERKRGYDAPVLRLYEDFLFKHWTLGWKGKSFYFPEISNSYIFCYDKKKYSKGENYQKFINDANKLKSLITDDSIIYLIDKEKWASLFAIQALTRAYHNLTWHNLRFFVNKNGLIEPIAYDGYSNNGSTENWFAKGVVGDLEKYYKNETVAINFISKLFLDDSFLSLYHEKLKHYQNKEVIDTFIKDNSKDFDAELAKLKSYYEYDLTIDFIHNYRLNLVKAYRPFTNEKFKGISNDFYPSLKNGEAPANEFYGSELIRGYSFDGKIKFVNGTKVDVTIYNNEGSMQLKAFSTQVVDHSESEFHLKLGDEKTRIEVCPWVPLQ